MCVEGWARRGRDLQSTHGVIAAHHSRDQAIAAWGSARRASRVRVTTVDAAVSVSRLSGE